MQNVINLIFNTYSRFHSCQRTLKELRNQNILFPRKSAGGYNRHTTHWREITHVHILHMIHNPIYAGVYQFGKRKTQKTLTGYKTTIQKKEDMIACIENHHEGYITIEQYRQNLCHFPPADPTGSFRRETCFERSFHKSVLFSPPVWIVQNPFCYI